MIVLKFGGTSVGSSENIEKIRNILESKSENYVVVVSAFSGVTNLLEQIANDSLTTESSTALNALKNKHHQMIVDLKINNPDCLNQIDRYLSTIERFSNGITSLNELSPRTLSKIMSFGELLSSTIIYHYLKQKGLKINWINSSELVKTDSQFLDATVNFKLSYTNIQTQIDKNSNYIVGGFTGTNVQNEITLLGRGGSDYTAAIFGAALQSPFVEIWSDVNGMLDANPKLVEQTQTIKQLSFNEALELSHFGAKVLYPKSIKPLRDYNIPLYLKNTFSLEETGTLVTNKNENEENKIKGVSSLSNISMLTFSGSCLAGTKGMASKIFKALEVVNIILITQSSSEQDICVAINSSEKDQALSAINSSFENEIAKGELDPIGVENDLAIIAIVGDHMKKQHGLSGEAFSVLGENGINIKAIAQGSTERNISIVIEQVDEKKALNVLHEKFFRQTTKKIHLFIAGMGNVGQEFLNILNQQKQYLKDHFRLDIKIIGLARSNGYYWDENGVDVNQLPQIQTAKFEDFVKKATTTNLRNAIFIDNSASDEVSKLYLPFLQHNMSLVTCNKVASASASENYKKLRKTAHQNHVYYMHETCVGAALPIIKTIQHIVLSGDKLTKIQACLSGSLSFIFNNYNASQPFVNIVKQAMAEGYTEPNPYIDLSGLDVKRKILILARESGYDIELEQVVSKSFLPQGADQAKTVEDFLKLLADNEPHFKNMFDNANQKNCRLKVVATFENGHASVGLEEIAPDHPFYYVEGKDNIISINSERYPEQPMIIKGAGAGAVVTASGVFSDLMLVINR